MVSNIIEFPARPAAKAGKTAPAGQPKGDVIPFRARAKSAIELSEQPITVPREREIAYLERALNALGEAKASGDLQAVREWRDEIQVLQMHSDWADICGRCKLALARG